MDKMNSLLRSFKFFNAKIGVLNVQRCKITYVKLYISNEIETTSCDCLEWCGFNTKESHFSLEYTIYNPRNMAAKIKCDEDMSIHDIM